MIPTPPREVVESAIRFKNATCAGVVTTALFGLGFENLIVGLIAGLFVWIWLMVLR